MKIAIVGHRRFNDYTDFVDKVEDALQAQLWEINEVVSGGAPGTDTLAELYAADINVPTRIHLPKWDQYGRSAGPVRNGLIVRDADAMIAFLHPDSKGTKDSIRQMKLAGKPVHIIQIGE